MVGKQKPWYEKKTMAQKLYQASKKRVVLLIIGFFGPELAILSKPGLVWTLVLFVNIQKEDFLAKCLQLK